MKQNRILHFPLLCILLSLITTSGYSQRESVLDEVVTIYDEIIYDIPEVSSWCDRLDLEGELTTAGDIRLFVETEGEGVPIVLLHGGPGATHHYFHPAFSRASEFAQVIYYDQRGCGLSDWEAGEGYTIQQAIDDLENLRIALGLEEWIVLGHSYGGLLAQMYTVTYPENVAGLILVGSAVNMTTVLKSSRQWDYFSEEELLRNQEFCNMEELTLPQQLYNRHINGDWKRQSYYRPTDEEIAEFVLYEWSSDPFFPSGVLRTAYNFDIAAEFLDCQIPTLIVEGRFDLTWNVDKPGVLHSQHPNAKMIYFENSGHDPFEDEPDIFFQELESFVLTLE